MRSPLQSRIPRRQGFLLLIAIVVPCLVVVALSWLMVELERQLEDNRQPNDFAVQPVQRQLLLLLETIKRKEIARIMFGSEREESQDLQEAVAFAGAFVDGRLRLPWEDKVEGNKFREWLNEADFANEIRKAEAEELVARQYKNAVTHYQQAIDAARHPPQQAYARLGLARSLAKSGRKRQSHAEFERVQALPPDLVDEHGIPLALYASVPLVEAGLRRKEMLDWIDLAVGRERSLPPAALYLVRDLAHKLQAPELEDRVARAIGDSEQAEELQRDFAMLERLVASPEPTWIRYGEAPWLLALTAPIGTRGRQVVAVRADQVLARLAPPYLIRVAEAGDRSGQSLGETFPGLRLVLPPPDPRAVSLRQVLLAISVLAVAFALLAGYLVQRDVRRTLRLAELRSQFVSSVTHELKTPLTAIRMFTETLRLDEELDRQTRGEYLDTILHESERLSRLVDNVLDFGSVERGRKAYRFEPVRLDEVVEGAARTIQYPIEQAGFALEVTVERDLPPVAADSDALEQAILNLLTNAMKYSGESRQIRLALDRKNGHARIHVEDHGIGIPRDEQGHIFERFYRVTTAENRHIPGAGLGLTLVAHIAKAHGGGVDLESSVGAGTTFTIRLPLPEGEAAERVRNNV